MLWGTDSNADVYLDGAASPANVEGSKYQFVDVNFFDTVGIRLRRGRVFTAQDTATSTRVAMVSESFARAFLADQDPSRTPHCRRVTDTYRTPARDRRDCLRQQGQQPSSGGAADVLQANRADTITDSHGRRPDGERPRAVAAGDCRCGARDRSCASRFRELRTQQGHLDEYVSDERTFAIAASFFGGLSLLVSAIGLFGLMSYSVARRTREIGIRMAVGAAPRQVLVGSDARDADGRRHWHGHRRGSRGGVQPLRCQLGIWPDTDRPVGIGLSAVVLVLVAAFAGYLPARRAASVSRCSP